LADDPKLLEASWRWLATASTTPWYVLFFARIYCIFIMFTSRL
jgi:hypothetical protein